MFESFDQEVKGNPIDSFVFWYGQIAACVFWVLVLVIKVLTFSVFWVRLSGYFVLCRRVAFADEFVRVLPVQEGLPGEAEKLGRRDDAELFGQSGEEQVRALMEGVHSLL